MKKHSYLHVILACSAFSSGFAATTLSSGDIAFLSYFSDNPDRFSFVTLTDLTASTVISFTDNGYIGGGDESGEGIGGGTWRASEDNLEWTSATSTISMGTVVTFDGTNFIVDGATNGSVAGSLGLSNTGDQLFAHQGSFSGSGAAETYNGTLIYGFNMDAGSWASSSTDTATSRLPSALASANANISDPERDNAVYEGPRNFTNTTAALAAIADPDNWATSNGNNLSGNADPFTVPEPSSLLLIGLGLFATLKRRR